MPSSADVLEIVHQQVAELVLSHQLSERVIDDTAGQWHIGYVHPTQGMLVEVTCWLGRHAQVHVIDEASIPNQHSWREVHLDVEPSFEDGFSTANTVELADAIAGALAVALYMRAQAADQPCRHGRRRWRLLDKVDRRERARTAYLPLD